MITIGHTSQLDARSRLSNSINCSYVNHGLGGTGHTQITRTKWLVNVVVAGVVALFIAGCVSSPASHSGTSGSGIAPLTSTDTLTNANDRSTWIDWPVGRVF